MSLPISFLSDFGLADEFVGVVRGVIAKLAPDSMVIDVTHGIPRGNIMAGALAMTRAIQYLPEGVALMVVDPGVGSGRKAIAAETEWGYFVGPDNGLMSPAVALTGGASRIVSIENPEVMIPSPGATFHGRDIFAPAAALLASGDVALGDLGPELAGDEVTPLLLPLSEIKPGAVKGQCWWVDQFGNAQTNIGPDDLVEIGLAPGSQVNIQIGASAQPVGWHNSYSEAGEGEPLIHVDSSGLIAVAVNGGHAADMFRLANGVAITMSPV